MAELRPRSERENEAFVRASRSAPPPDWQPMYGGLAGMAVFCIPYVLFNGIAPVPLALTAVVGFLLPFFFLKRRQNEHERELARERTALGLRDDS